METWKKLSVDYREGKLSQYILENYPESSQFFGILVAIPLHIDPKDASALYEEFEHPTEFTGEAHEWKLWAALQCREGWRDRSTVELLFCMLRSRHNAANASSVTHD